MILFCLRSFLLMPLLALELLLFEVLHSWTPQLSVLCLLFCALRLELRAVWQLLLPLMAFSSFLEDGGLVVHSWLVLLFFLIAVHARKILVPERWQMQVLLAILIAAGLATLRSLLLNEGLGDPLGRGLKNWLMTGLLAPPVLFLLDLFYKNLPKLPLLTAPMPGSLSEGV